MPGTEQVNMCVHVCVARASFSGFGGRGGSFLKEVKSSHGSAAEGAGVRRTRSRGERVGWRRKQEAARGGSGAQSSCDDVQAHYLLFLSGIGDTPQFPATWAGCVPDRPRPCSHFGGAVQPQVGPRPGLQPRVTRPSPLPSARPLLPGRERARPAHQETLPRSPVT